MTRAFYRPTRDDVLIVLDNDDSIAVTVGEAQRLILAVSIEIGIPQEAVAVVLSGDDFAFGRGNKND